MALLDRYAPEAEDDRRAVHVFAAATQLWAEQKITRATVINALNLDSSDEPQLDAIAAVYAGKPDAVSKLGYLLLIERILVVLESGRINKTQAAAFLEI